MPQVTFRKELYTEIIRDGEVVGLYKQDGHIRAYSVREVTAAGLDKMVGADQVEPQQKG